MEVGFWDDRLAFVQTVPGLALTGEHHYEARRRLGRTEPQGERGKGDRGEWTGMVGQDTILIVHRRCNSRSRGAPAPKLNAVLAVFVTCDPARGRSMLAFREDL